MALYFRHASFVFNIQVSFFKCYVYDLDLNF